MHKQINTTDGNETIVFIETFKDAQALQDHRNGQPYKDLMKRAGEEQLLLAMPDIKILEVVGGFGLRE